MKKSGQPIRRMGFIRDQEGIMNRYLRESSNWQTHLQNTRNFISASFTGTRAESVAVLGSGWLLDVPLDDLVRRFKKVYLVDINHPVQIRKKTSNMSQVELTEADLTGGAIEKVWQYAHEKNTGSPIIPETFDLNPPLDHIRADAYISVNLLNQLDILLCDYMVKQMHFQQDELSSFRSAIQAFHLNWISKKPGVLVSDVREVVEDKQGMIESKALLYTDLPGGIRRDSWWWEFDTMGTYHSESRTRMEVQAVEWI